MVKRFNNSCILPVVIIALFLAGCAPLIVGGAAVTAGAGTYVYVQGELKTDYPNSFEEVWAACERVVADMQAIDVVPSKEIGNARIEALIDNERVRISVQYKSKNLTNVSVRVGVLGDRTASQRIHDKIAANLS
ncbi:MAG TPA: DUF3568 family protein [Deltaproteobacteria bacterium]|jgi:hypothetical protein|nr:DUF3568 family protein [Deltaproteobacteria bacterium]